MEQVCLVLPVQPGRTNDAREFMRELETARKDDYAGSERRIPRLSHRRATRPAADQTEATAPVGRQVSPPIWARTVARTTPPLALDVEPPPSRG
jgi:hypothetical protein